MTNPTQMPKRDTSVPEAVAPKCPHCGHELATVGLYSWMYPPWMILGTHCPNAECRAVLHQQIVPVVDQAQQTDEPPSGPRIHRPS